MPAELPGMVHAISGHSDEAREGGSVTQRARGELALDRRVWIFSAVLVVLASLVQASLWEEQPPHPVSGAWVLALLGGFVLAELFVAHIRIGSEAHTFAFAELPLVLGLFYFPPELLIGARVGGALVALVIHRRQPLLKLTFNLAQYWLSAACGVWLWYALSDGSLHSQQSWIAAVLAAVVADVIAGLAVVLVMGLRGQAHQSGLLRVTMLTGVITAATNASLALVALDVLEVDWRGSWALLGVAAFLVLAQRSHVQLQRRHDSLEQVDVFNRDVSASLQLREVVERVLEGVRSSLECEIVQLHLDEGAAQGGCYQLDRSGLQVLSGCEHARGAAREEADEKLLATVSGSETRGGAQRLHAVLAGQGGESLGELRAVGRLGDLAGFGVDDQRMLSALASHAGVALTNASLTDELRAQLRENEHASLHDALTGLPNRTAFQLAVGGALQREQPVAVLLLDLDRFKEVNDTLGHAAGDELLRGVGMRLQTQARAGEMIARLGGDEFAVLLVGEGAEEASARRAGQRLLQLLAQPTSLAHLVLSVEPSIGIALGTGESSDAETLLRQADIAMYVAKESRSGVECYRDEIDTHSAERLSLIGELREAIARGELSMMYQPKVSCTGTKVSAEALMRWMHPQRGWVSPEEFIGVAEQTGLIGELTGYSLRAALDAARSWREAGVACQVAVNLSPRLLRDTAIVSQVEAALAEAGLPPTALTLEVTEGAIMSEPERAIEVLAALRAAGIRLSIDDLGTGHSSLSYLKRLPVHEVKVDKSFVMQMVEDEADDAIVESMAHLAKRLGMECVAEGVESEEIFDRLVELGCDTAQGYWVSRPIPASEVPEFIRQWSARVLDREKRGAGLLQVPVQEPGPYPV